MSSKNLDTRIRIMKAAWALLEDKRSKGSRMSDIAKKAGVSRQALYLHFNNRADLLVETMRYMDEEFGVEDALRPSRETPDGIARMLAFIEAIGAHFPNVQGVARALMAIKDSDPEAMIAWNDRMDAIRDGCSGAILALDEDGALAEGWSVETATALFWAMLSFETWDHLTRGSGWSDATYIKHMKRMAEKSFAR